MAETFPAPAARKHRIVLLDDEPSILKTWKAILEVYGFEVSCFERAMDALTQISAGCDCVVTDYHMPDMTGIEVIEATRLLSKTRIILMTANDSPKLKKAATAAGADCVVSKPAPINSVVQMIEELCSST
jgi:CheY-like chemotaxis protein